MGIIDEVPLVGNIGLTFEEMTEIITAIISNEQIASLLPQSIREKLNVQTNIDNAKETVAQVDISENIAPVPDPAHETGLSYAQQETFNSFSEHYNYLMTVKGFNQDEYVKVEKIMIQKFGTVDLADFNYKLLNDKLPKQTMEQKLSAAKQKANEINNSRTVKENKDISSKEITKE